MVLKSFNNDDRDSKIKLSEEGKTFHFGFSYDPPLTLRIVYGDFGNTMGFSIYSSYHLGVLLVLPFSHIHECETKEWQSCDKQTTELTTILSKSSERYGKVFMLFLNLVIGFKDIWFSKRRRTIFWNFHEDKNMTGITSVVVL